MFLSRYIGDNDCSSDPYIQEIKNEPYTLVHLVVSKSSDGTTR